MSWFLSILLFPGRLKYRWKNRHRRRVTDSLIETLKTQCSQAREHRFRNHELAYNAALFVVLIEQGLSAYSAALYYANSKWHRQFAARGMAVLLYEASNDIPKVFGKEYRRMLRDLDKNESWEAHLNQSIAGFNRFREEHAEFLKCVRNFVGAHKELDALKQLSVLEGLNYMAVYQLAATFSNSLRLLVDFQMVLLAHLKKPSVLFEEGLKVMRQ